MDLLPDYDSLINDLWPICRSIAGPAYRESLARVRQCLPLKTIFYKSGMQVHDWIIPQEWQLKRGVLHGPSGILADTNACNLAVWSHSMPVSRDCSLEELRPHLHTSPLMPEAVPYRTTYYDRNWGFCLPHAMGLEPGRYQANIDATLQDGHVVVAESILPGDSAKELLFSTYLCHPSMANNELSGPLALIALHRALSARNNRYTCRFVICPETIGSICYLWSHGGMLRQTVQAGLVLTCVGDKAALTYKQARTPQRGDLLMHGIVGNSLRAYDPTRGSDERNYCSPGFDLPMGVLMRSVPGEFPEYHTSADNQAFISKEQIIKTVEAVLEWVESIERSKIFVRIDQCGAIQLGRRGLYPSGGTVEKNGIDTSALMWVADQADGTKDIGQMAERSELPIATIEQAVHILREHNILKEVL